MFVPTARTLAIAFTLSLAATPALAYIGPGAGLGAIGTVLAIIGAFLLLIVGFVWYPVKRLLRARKARLEAMDEKREETAGGTREGEH